MNRRSINLLSGHQTAVEQTVDTGKTNLFRLLDSWAEMEEEKWTTDQVETLRGNIQKIFFTQTEAGAWFRIWRAQNPGVEMC
jgi:hypothetical protein